MSYTVQYEKRALKELSKLPATAVRQILTKIDSLSTDPYQTGIKKLKGFENVFRARAGNYRILYEVNDGKLLIMIVVVGDRKDVYDQ
ncbi:type II toxin-antitoxin system RelE/ParE family toxin [Dyadobacter chenwenxiniae]|uniref:Type II toxin-antitoxin system RelE/ParE family toxin n=1 Tax=Dyadobacter chenwenxiniae TaxID=2906456 RepID=A0A9X1THU0_9BACT|nr:type II toxin-antitoxin system RelE/ParE family toxin [Dyadobacter chenwenxiniae]MCF0065140.1 type II toxin-antitoxin system RelE/ParE family toxin [Dyadobacter chenwenxiniae]UON84588.1 type II toxin-antitoxin system RelE/ParE family toxin [Dyadobacter chenwenxiniae]